MPPIIFEVVVDTNEDDAVPVSQLPHPAVDLTDPNAHPSRSAPSPYSETLLFRQDISWPLLPL
jgi:hypothetical protein